jgi:hypothetical protein
MTPWNPVPIMFPYEFSSTITQSAIGIIRITQQGFLAFTLASPKLLVMLLFSTARTLLIIITTR